MYSKEPRQVAAAARIAAAVRDAMADAMAQHVKDPWDPEVLCHEVARLLGVLLRGDGATPDQLDNVVRFLREVYAGVYSGSAMSVQQAIEQYCGASVADRGNTPPNDPSVDQAVH